MAMQIIQSERAFTIWYKGNAQIITEYDEYFRTVNPDIKFKKPSIIRVDKWINMTANRVPLSKENIFKRDNHECVYCGSNDKKSLTLDHVIPQSKGGLDSWENLVTACKKCNNEKDSLTIEEWGKEEPKPYRPHFLLMIKKYSGDIPDEWKQYLFF
jgi:hypothetical protein